MRKLLLLSALIFSALHVYAGENEIQESVTSAPTVGGLFPHFGLGNNPNAIIPANHRMIAKAYHKYENGNFVPVDSITYQYSNGRGSVPNPDNINNDEHVLFDLSTTYDFNTISAMYEHSRQRIQSFTGNKVSELVYKKWHTITSAWKNSERYLYTYDNNGKMHSSILQTWYGTLWTNDINSVLNYDQNNNIIQMNSSTYTIDFVYDPNNNLIMIADKTWTQGIGWSNHERKGYNYANDNITEYVLEKWVNNQWVNTEKWEYSYDQKDNIITATQYIWNAGTWKKSLQEGYVYDTDDNMLEKVIKNWDASFSVFVNKSKEIRSYNKNNLTKEIISYSWDGSNWIHADNDIIVRYYYEQYFPTNVSIMAADNAEMTVYPVPASENLHVSFNISSVQDFSIVIADMAGKAVYMDKVTGATAYSKTIPVDNIPSGTYLLRVHGTNGMNLTRKLSVVH